MSTTVHFAMSDASVDMRVSSRSSSAKFTNAIKVIVALRGKALVPKSAMVPASMAGNTGGHVPWWPHSCVGKLSVL